MIVFVYSNVIHLYNNTPSWITISFIGTIIAPGKALLAILYQPIKTKHVTNTKIILPASYKNYRWMFVKPYSHRKRPMNMHENLEVSYCQAIVTVEAIASRTVSTMLYATFTHHQVQH